jgi:hypothetical protein
MYVYVCVYVCMYYVCICVCVCVCVCLEDGRTTKEDASVVHYRPVSVSI